MTLFGKEKVVLQLSWLHQFQFAGYYVAKELGYYKEAGIEVEIKEFNFQTDLTSVVQNREADFAVGRSSLLIEKINGKDVVALGAIFQESPLMLLVTQESHINSLNDLKNKRIMLTGDAKNTASIMAMLSSKGIMQQDIQILPHSFELNDLLHNKTDAMASYVSNEPIVMSDKGIGYKIFDPKDYGFHFYDDILFSSSAFIKKNPHLTKDFYEATLKGWQYAFENISFTAELIHKLYNTQNKTVMQLIKEGEVLRELAQNEDGLGYISKSKLGEIMNTYKVLGLVTKNIDLDTFVYEHNHPKEFKFILRNDEILFSVVVFVLVLIIFILSILFISLRNHWLHTKGYLKEKIEKQKKEIEKQNRMIIAQSKIGAIGEMLSNIAHQWRQPLNIISLSTVKLETSILLGEKMKNEEYLQISQEINRQTEYLSQTINDFRNYFSSNMEDIAPFHISNTIKKVSDLTREIFRTNGIEVVTSVDDCLLTHNENLLVQALLNIYNNAQDAIIDNASAEKYFFIDVRCMQEEVIIRLKDSGGGIQEDITGKIFEPYFTTKKQSLGTGLGLYITYEIVTKHFNGTISVNNAHYNYIGKKLSGAEFVITIPMTLEL